MSDTDQSAARAAATERYEALFHVSQSLISIRSSEELFRLLARELRAVVNFYVMASASTTRVLTKYVSPRTASQVIPSKFQTSLRKKPSRGGYTKINSP